MEFISHLWRKLSYSSRYDPQNEETQERMGNALRTNEHFLVGLQRIILWEDVAQSLTALIAVQAVFWLYVVYQPAPIFLLSSLLLAHVLYEWYSGTAWPEIRLPPEIPPDPENWTPVGNRVLSAPELDRYLARVRAVFWQTLDHMKQLRRDSPLKYLSACFSVCVSVYWLGSLLSGFSLLYLLVTSVLTLPGVALYCLPQSFYDYLHRFSDRLRSHLLTAREAYFGVAEFVPDSNVQNSALLEVAAGIVNGREPSPDLLELSAFTSGLSPPPSLDYHSLTSADHSDDELSLAPPAGDSLHYQQSADSVVDGGSSQQQQWGVTGTVLSAAAVLAGYVRERLYGGDVSLPHQPRHSSHPQTGESAPAELDTAQVVSDSDFEML